MYASQLTQVFIGYFGRFSRGYVILELYGTFKKVINDTLIGTGAEASPTGDTGYPSPVRGSWGGDIPCTVLVGASSCFPGNRTTVCVY